MQFFSFLITKIAKHSFLRVNIRKDVHLSKQLFLGFEFFLFFSVKLPAFMIYHDLLRQSMNINIFNCLFASFLYEIIELFFFIHTLLHFCLSLVLICPVIYSDEWLSRFSYAIFSLLLWWKFWQSPHEYLNGSHVPLKSCPLSPLHPPSSHNLISCPLYSQTHSKKTTSNFSLILISYLSMTKNFTLIPSVILFILEVLFVNIFTYSHEN